MTVKVEAWVTARGWLAWREKGRTPVSHAYVQPPPWSHQRSEANPSAVCGVILCGPHVVGPKGERPAFDKAERPCIPCMKALPAKPRDKQDTEPVDSREMGHD